MSTNVDMLNEKKIAIIGLGLIGGSIARGLTSRQSLSTIVAVGRNQDVLQQAKDDGVISDFSASIKEACTDADIIVIAVPTLTVAAVLAELKTAAKKDAVITDAASVKQAVVDAATEVYGEVPANFVLGHPVAGSEHSGYFGINCRSFCRKKKSS